MSEWTPISHRPPLPHIETTPRSEASASKPTATPGRSYADMAEGYTTFDPELQFEIERAKEGL